MILKQGAIYKYNAKGKWSDAWYIYSHDDGGPHFTIYKDSTAKKGPEISISLVAVANDVRFGRTSHRTVERPSSATKDIRIHDSCFISIPLERTLKKTSKREVLWLCTVSVLELYDLVKLFSYSLAVLRVQPPAFHYDDGINSVYSLHRYKPMAFIAETTWERFYDNPPQEILCAQTENSQISRTSSVDVLGEKKVLKSLKGRFLKNEQKEASKSLNALNVTPNHEYDEVAEASNEKPTEKSIFKGAQHDESAKGIQQEIRYGATVLKTPLDEIQLTHDSTTKHTGNTHENASEGSQNSSNAYGVICSNRPVENLPNGVSKEKQNGVIHSAGSTETSSVLDSTSRFNSELSQYIDDVDVQLTLCRSRELNEKPMVAPKPKNPRNVPSPILSTLSIPLQLPTPSSDSPSKLVMRSMPTSSRTTTVSETYDSSEQNVSDDTGVVTVVSFTLKPSEDSKMKHPPDGSQSNALKLKISDLQVESEGESRIVAASVQQRTTSTMDQSASEQEFPLLTLKRNREYNEMDTVEKLDKKIEGPTTIIRPPPFITSKRIVSTSPISGSNSLVSSDDDIFHDAQSLDRNLSTGYYCSDYDIRKSNEVDFMRNGAAQVRVIELNL